MMREHSARITRHASRLTVCAVLVSLPLILLAPIVFGGQVLYWGVPLMQFYPWQHYAAEMWRSGEAPLWNPLLGKSLGWTHEPSAEKPQNKGCQTYNPSPSLHDISLPNIEISVSTFERVKFTEYIIRKV